MANLLPPNATPLERAIAAVGSRTGSLPVAIRDLWNPERCPVELLPWLAATLAIDEWSDHWDEAAKRAAVANAILVHRRRGTVWSLKQSLASLGMTVDVIEQAAQRAVYAILNTPQVDGTWRLNGHTKIAPTDLVANLPQIQHWFQFIVRTNLADATRAENFALLRPLVQKWKPVRSIPIFIFWIAFALEVDAFLASSLQVTKNIGLRYPWRGRVIGDAPELRWSLGRNATVVTLPQPFGFRLGARSNGAAGWRLKSERIVGNTLVTSTATALAYPLPRLDAAGRRLDGTWRIGGRHLDTDSHAVMQSRLDIALPHQVETTHRQVVQIDYPASPARLAGNVRLAPWRRLDGSWSVGGSNRARPFGFKLGREGGVLTEGVATVASTTEVWGMPERLTRQAAVTLGFTARRIDGSWRLRAENRVGQFRLDGRRLRVTRLAVCPRLGQFSLAADLPGVTDYARGPVRRLKLNGQWRIGGVMAPEFTLTITKEQAHG